MKKSAPIESLNLPKRIENSLKNFGKIETVEELKEKEEVFLVDLRGIGEKGVEIIKEALKDIP